MRLVTFGCSYTFGQGLEDCFVLPNNSGPAPSKFAWPQLLANAQNLRCINMSNPGSSNKEILNTLLKFRFESTDIVIIMWSFTERWCILNRQGNVATRLRLSEIDSGVMLQYDKIFTVHDLQLDFIYRANFAKMHLDNKNLKNYHLSVAPDFCLPPVMPKWNIVDFIKINMTWLRDHNPPALDIASGNPHPGPEAHQILAQELCDEIFNAHNK